MNAHLHDAADLSPLSWVQEEIRRSLEAVAKQLRRQLREFELRQAAGQLDAGAFATVLNAQAHALHQRQLPFRPGHAAPRRPVTSA